MTVLGVKAHFTYGLSKILLQGGESYEEAEFVFCNGGNVSVI